MKSVLITGGSGSFGNAMTKRLLGMKTPPDRIVIYSRGEHAQEAMARSFNNHPNLRFFIGDVRDSSRLAMAMRGVDTVFHAAALKVVPIAEYNPFECVMTNIHGAENVVRAAISTGVRKVIALSTDKAVSPINLYGATKLAAEKIFIAANNLSAGTPTAFSVVRYGNVVGSNGSVLPLFRRLAAEGKPLPITDTRMTRFWIEMDDTITFILECELVAHGREIFIPKIPSIKITDLAAAIGGATKVVGIRPGEKLHETLLTEDEARCCYEHDRGFVIVSKFIAAMSPPEGFRYSSDTNTQWLSVENLKSRLTASAVSPPA